MKKINFTLFILIALAVNVFAQIPNNGFENWTNMGSYYNPVSWACLNDETASAGVFTCERGTPGDPGNYFLKLTSKPVGPEIVPASIFSGTFNPVTMVASPGFAYSQRPDSITGNWQHMVMGTSQGYIAIQLTYWNDSLKMSMPVASVNYILTGMAMDWVYFSIPLTYINGKNPDTCIITLSASGSSPTNGDYLYIDNLAFKGGISGISPVKPDPKFSIFPNPASDFATLNINNPDNENLVINIYTITGELVRSEVMRQNQLQINTGDLNNGIYMVAVKSKDMTETQRLIIQR